MPNPPKQFLSKAERILKAQLPGAKKVAAKARRRYRVELREDGANSQYSRRYNPALMGRLRQEIDRPRKLEGLSTPEQKRGGTSPSSRNKKVPKEGDRKFIGPRRPSPFIGEYENLLRYNPYRGYKKRTQRQDEIRDARLFKKNPLDSVKLAVSDRIGRAKDKDLPMAPFGTSKSLQRWMSIQRARAAELIRAARKLKDPKTRAKVLGVIQRELGSYRKRNTNEQDIPS